MTTHSESSDIRQIELRLAELSEGFEVARALPTKKQRLVGPWCFLDHLGPADLAQGAGLHIGAHPHTCLQTFTWMMQGEILHRDSLGFEQIIRPGQVNLMTAGHGVSHTEDSIGSTGLLHTAQLWIALPPEHQDTAAAFEHHADLPAWSVGKTTVTLLAGEFAGQAAPARVYSDMVGLDLLSEAGDDAILDLRPDFEYAILPTQGRVGLEGKAIGQGHFSCVPVGHERVKLSLAAGSRCLLVGGRPFASEVHMWWNFVASSREYITQAFMDWQAGSERFGQVAGAARRLNAPAPPWLTM